MTSSLQSIIPKLPSRDLKITKQFYTSELGFHQVGSDYEDYLMLSRDQIEIHFFRYKDLDALNNYGMCYIRVSNIEELYTDMKNKNVQFASLGKLEVKPWKQKEFSIIDNDHNLLTFGQGI